MRNTYINIPVILILFIVPEAYPQRIEFANSFLYTGGPHSIQVLQDFAYIAGDYSLHIVSIEDPSSPFLVGGFTFRKPVSDVRVAGNTVFAIDPFSSLYIVDVTNKRQPELIAGTDGFQGAEYYQGVRTSANYAYIAGADGLIIFDISDLSNPILVSHDPVGRYYGLAIRGNHVFTVGSAGLRIFDVADPTDPYSIGHCNFEGDPLGIALAGNYAFVSSSESNHDYSALTVIDISDLEHPVEISSCETPGQAHKIYHEGQYVYLADGDAGLQIINVSNPESPYIEQNVGNPGWNVGICYRDSIVFLGNAGPVGCGLYLFDVQDIEMPVLCGFYKCPDQNNRLHGSNEHVLVAAGFSGAYIAQLNPPGVPVIEGIYDSLPYASSVFVKDSCAYISTGGHEFHIVDISDSSNPQQLGIYRPASLAIGEFIRGSYAYIIHTTDYHDGGFEIVDISNSSSPELISTYEAPYRVRDIFVCDEYVCITGEHFGLEFIDISNPLEPSLAGSYNELQDAYGVYLSDATAYVTAGYEGLSILDISNPESISQIASCETPGYAINVVVSDQLAYVACSDSGVAVVDISDPANPRYITGNSMYRGHDLFVQQDLIYMLNVYSLVIFRFDRESGTIDEVRPIPGSFSLSRNYPNPFNSSTTIRYDLPKQSHVEIEIFDIMGRSIKRLVSDNKSAGAYTVTWDAKNVSSGIYFYRIKAGNFSESRSCVLLK